MSYFPSDIFTYSELPLFQITEEVSTFEYFHNNVDVVLVLKYVIQPNDVVVLAYLKHFNFSLEQL